MLAKVESEITSAMYGDTSSKFDQLDCKDDAEFQQYVDKFEFDLGIKMERNNMSTISKNVARKYPITLPYTKFVVDVLNHLTVLIHMNLDYW